MLSEYYLNTTFLWCTGAVLFWVLILSTQSLTHTHTQRASAHSPDEEVNPARMTLTFNTGLSIESQLDTLPRNFFLVSPSMVLTLPTECTIIIFLKQQRFVNLHCSPRRWHEPDWFSWQKPGRAGFLLWCQGVLVVQPETISYAGMDS